MSNMRKFTANVVIEANGTAWIGDGAGYVRLDLYEKACKRIAELEGATADPAETDTSDVGVSTVRVPLKINVPLQQAMTHTHEDAARCREWCDALARYDTAGKGEAMMAVVIEMINYDKRIKARTA